MTPSLLIRPVLVLAAAAALSACGMVESDPNRFENLARRVADIPVSMDRPGEAARAGVARTADLRSAGELGLRSASAPLRVEVLDPHDLWDARDGVEQTVVQRVAEAAAPVVADAVAREVTNRVAPRSAESLGLRPARVQAVRPTRMVQLGAFASEGAAREAWGRMRRDATLATLKPVYEAVEVNGRRLVRLKVAAPAGAAAAVCAAARIDDPWCRRGT